MRQRMSGLAGTVYLLLDQHFESDGVLERDSVIATIKGAGEVQTRRKVDWKLAAMADFQTGKLQQKAGQ
jgi:hypothetical protein